MANIIQYKLDYLEETKRLIQEAIAAKGVSVSDTDTFRSYADKIEAIETGGGGTVNIPDGTKFAYSRFTTVPTEIIPYLEAQTDLSYMFYFCQKLTSIPLFSTSSVDDMSSMFTACTITSVPQLDTSRVTNMYSMFQSCTSIKTVPLFNTSSVTNMGSMFDRCFSLTSVPQLDTSKVTNMGSMFYYCEALKTIPLLNVSSVDNMRTIFGYCNSLTNLGGFTGLKVNLSLSSSSKLTVDSVMNVINYAADMSSFPQTLTLHHKVFNKLSEEQIATAGAKGWNIASI